MRCNSSRSSARAVSSFAADGVRAATGGKVPVAVLPNGIDATAWAPVAAGLHLLAACRSQAPEEFALLATSWEGAAPHLDLLAGTPRVRAGLAAGEPVPALVASWRAELAEFRETRAKHLLYA